MQTGFQIKVDLSFFKLAMNAAIDGHVADLKETLRAIEDGSYESRANAKRPDAVIHFTTSDRARSIEGAAQRSMRKCFKAIGTELVTFLDSMVGTRRLLVNGIPSAGRPLYGEEQIREYVQFAVDAEIAKVARDRSLTNPAKIDELGIPSAAAERLKEFIALRNCLEHHRGVPKAGLTIRLDALTLRLGDRVVESLPMEGREGEGLTVGIDQRTLTFPKGHPVQLSEADIEQTLFTVMMLADEVVQALDSRYQGDAPNP